MKTTTFFAIGTAVFCLLLLLLTHTPDVPTAELPEETTAEPQMTEPELFDQNTTLRVLFGQEVREIPLDEYLTGVLFAEMPADFGAEALKAQAVASRTFTLRQSEQRKHSDADVCTDAACCQGWRDPLDSPDAAVFADAVRQTDGLVVTYGDALIDATYFSCSGGKTEAAAAVWGGEVPYLQSVESPDEGESYNESRTWPAEEFAEVFTAAYPEAVLSGEPSAWFGAASYTRGGGIERICIGGVELKGTTLRALFGLRSTDIHIAADAQSVTFSTAGFGHRVGMSQYGAAAMAENGSGFAEILCHYYRSTEIKRLSRQATGQP